MPHSDVKIRLLKKYLEVYLSILSTPSLFWDVHLFDLFCGPGYYEKGEKGSPVIILETIKDVYFTNKPRFPVSAKFHCYFNDRERSKIEILKTEIASRNLHYPEIGQLEFTTLDYQVLLPRVAQKVNSFSNQRAFIFIDPYGYKDIKVSDLRTLLQSKKAEVLLFLPTQFMFRFESKGTPHSLFEFINELLPEDEWPKSSTGIDFIDKLKEAFRKNLGSEYFVDTFIIKRDRERNQFFCLFFFTSHIYGFDRMLHAKWKLDETQGRGWNYETDSGLFSQSPSADIVKFEKALIDFLRTEKTNKEVYEFTLHKGHLPRHAIQVLKKLQAENKLSKTNPDGTAGSKTAFFLTYKQEPSKQLLYKIKP